MQSFFCLSVSTFYGATTAVTNHMKKTRKDNWKEDSGGLILCREKAQNETIFVIFKIYSSLYDRKYSKAFA